MHLRTIARITASLTAVVFCLFLMLLAARYGFSRLLSRYGVMAMSLPATTEAIRLAPFDAEAHRAQATVFTKFQMYTEARRELELAVSLRPHDDYLWMELGIVRDELGDSEGALKAFDRAVENAPFYAHTHWQRANLRLRLGRYDEAFAELRTAANSNHRFLPTLIDLAWNLSGQNIQLTEQLAGIQSTAARIEFARFLARKGKGKETIDEFRQVANEMAPVYRTELVRELIATKQFPEAFEIWRYASGDKAVNNPAVYDGGFEGPITFSESGFGWRILHDPKLDVSQDGSDKDTGARSLRIIFNGHSSTPDSIVSQIIIIRAQAKYRVSFAFKTDDLMSGSPLVLQVSDAVNNQVLKDFEIAPGGTWRRQSFDFDAPHNCGTIQLKLVRKGCSAGPCQIFGTLWLDSFSIEQLTQ
jgi:tetratricopeptide (TPR) repeat protein